MFRYAVVTVALAAALLWAQGAYAQGPAQSAEQRAAEQHKYSFRPGEMTGSPFANVIQPTLPEPAAPCRPRQMAPAPNCAPPQSQMGHSITVPQDSRAWQRTPGSDGWQIQMELRSGNGQPCYPPRGQHRSQGEAGPGRAPHAEQHESFPPVPRRYWVEGGYQFWQSEIWVPDHYEERWVPPILGTEWRDGREVIIVVQEGYYEPYFVPGHYERVTQSLWIPGHWESVW